MATLFAKLRFWATQNQWRPWAMLTPALVLIICLPLLRPLFWPGQPSQSEALLMASVRSVVQGDALALDPNWAGAPGTVLVDQSTYAIRPPLFAVILAGQLYLLTTFTALDPVRDEAMISYLLTMIGVTLPTAVGASMLYRVARLFELPRPWRAAVALMCVMASGWISYATVLSPHATATAFVTSSLMVVMLVGAARRVVFALPWLLMAGLLAGLAVAIDPWTLQVVPVLLVVVLGFAVNVRQRLIAALLIVVGTLPVVWAHSAWSITTVGSFFPPVPSNLPDLSWADDRPDGSIEGFLPRVFTTLLGNNGLLAHFPLIIAGLVGMGIILRRHWPAHAKLLAGGMMLSLAVCVMMSSLGASELTGDMFAIRWSVTVLPIVLLFNGALLRDWLLQDRLTLGASQGRLRARRWGTTLFIFALAYSVMCSLFGATGALPERPYGGHTAFNAVGRAISR